MEKRKIYISIIIVAVVALTVGFGIAFVPQLATFKTRLMASINVFIPIWKGKVYYDRSTVDRFGMFVDGIVMWLRKPIFGFGNHAFFICSSYGFSWSHNTFSELLCEYGFVGFIFFMFPLCFAFLQVKKDRKKRLMLLPLMFFATINFSVAVESQKIYAYSIGIIVGYAASDTRPYFEVQFIDLLKRFFVRRNVDENHAYTT